ncbi:rhodanese-like domain-containing protein [Marinifilum caeruleilacunae]|uniref:Rhodanese-like domain-containing protein n=1 Tax=Marinifilum caeruleilacunae TaxID=2499076 RepID=A0ABX1WZH0_9BACT|nr:rhodanese-like domain-containing protein [Marinifilum caeruleilacunae]NOU61563.1 rhodanese-like domain-containing protein [Marinifilum caeruleilacunae]
MKFVKIVIALLFVLMIQQNAFSQVDTVQVLSPKQFLRVSKLNPQAVMIDVRLKKDFKKGHIEGALMADTSEKLYQIIDSLGPKKTYLLYCKYGERSITAGKFIYEKYNIHVCSLQDGLDYWKELKMEVVK